MSNNTRRVRTLRSIRAAAKLASGLSRNLVRRRASEANLRPWARKSKAMRGMLRSAKALCAWAAAACDTRVKEA